MDLRVLAWVSIAVAVGSAVLIAMDEVRHPQRMAVMQIVWPITALYGSLFALYAYFVVGRKHAKGTGAHHEMQHGVDHDSGEPATPTPAQVALGTSHCGAGCTLADLGTEFAIAASGFAWFGSVLWTEYLLDFVAAWMLGIVFQYFAIRPMRPELNVREVIWAAVKADTLSILAFQVGMYLWMALVYFRLFPAPNHLTAFDPRYCLMMQVAMICGFATSYPMNRFLIRLGLKEAM